MTFEGAWADAHAQRALLVGIALADQLQDLALALGQGPLAYRQRGALGPAGFACPSAALLDVAPCARERRRFVGDGDLLDQGADPLGLLQGVVDDLLQIRPVFRA